MCTKGELTKIVDLLLNNRSKSIKIALACVIKWMFFFLSFSKIYVELFVNKDEENCWKVYCNKRQL
jgi:hypothetical protein